MENITQKMTNGVYTQQDALFEIMILLLGAFALGWAARYIWETSEEEKEVLASTMSQEVLPRSKLELKTYTKEKKDDMRLIEGVGPKIESLLEREGIDSFEKLSQKSVQELQEVLKKAGDRYAFHNPTTWPEQAFLAYEGKWEELAEFQDFLKGGKAL